MAPVQTHLLTIGQIRSLRNAMSERDLMHRCKDAARLELRGAMFSPDDRLDVASQIMVDGLAETGGATPNADDPKHSLGSYCKRAQTCRRSLERQRGRDNLAAELEEDRAAWSIDALVPAESLPAEVTASEATHTAVEACRRLGLDDSKAPMLALFYGYARDLPGPVVAAELGMSPNAYDVACCRARSLIRELYPTAVEFLRALVGETTTVLDRMTGEMVLRFVKIDASKEAHDRTHLLAEDWRDGTCNGHWPTRPENANQARSACEVYGGSVRWQRGAPVRAKKSRAKIDEQQVQADSLRRLGYALGAR